MKATRFNAFTHLPSTLTINHQSVLNSHPWFPMSSVSARQVGDRAYSPNRSVGRSCSSPLHHRNKDLTESVFATCVHR